MSQHRSKSGRPSTSKAAPPCRQDTCGLLDEYVGRASSARKRWAESTFGAVDAQGGQSSKHRSVRSVGKDCSSGTADLSHADSTSEANDMGYNDTPYVRELPDLFSPIPQLYEEDGLQQYSPWSGEVDNSSTLAWESDYSPYFAHHEDQVQQDEEALSEVSSESSTPYQSKESTPYPSSAPVPCPSEEPCPSKETTPLPSCPPLPVTSRSSIPPTNKRPSPTLSRPSTPTRPRKTSRVSPVTEPISERAVKKLRKKSTSSETAPSSENTPPKGLASDSGKSGRSTPAMVLYERSNTPVSDCSTETALSDCRSWPSESDITAVGAEEDCKGEWFTPASEDEIYSC